MNLILLACVFVLSWAEDEGSLAQLNAIIERGDLSGARTYVKRFPELPKRPHAKLMNHPLHTAAKYGNADMVKFLLEHGAPVNVKNEYGNTPLHEATGKAVVKQLVAAGASKELINKDRQTPLQHAAERQRKSVVQAMMEAGAVLDYASAVKAGLDVEVKGMLQKEPWLPKRPSMSLFDAVYSGNTMLVELLLKHGADPSIERGYVNIPGRYTPLSDAVLEGNFEIAKLLCEAGAEANVSGGRNHGSLLLYCLAFKEPRYTELLVKHGARVSGYRDFFSDEKQLTPLHVAAGQGGMNGTTGYNRVGEPDHDNSKREWAAAKVQALLAAQADPQAAMQSGATPLHHALLARNQDVVQLLIKEGAKTDLFAACAMGHLEKVHAMLRQKPETINKDKLLEWPPLYWAVLSGQVKMVELLLAHHAETNTAASVLEYHPASAFGKPHDQDEKKRTISALTLAVQLGHIDIVRALLKADASVDGDQNEYSPPISVACENGHREIVKLLLQYKANLNHDSEHLPPLAAALSDRKLVDLLLDHGADPNIRVSDETLLWYALRESHDVAKQLVSRGAKLDLHAACVLNKAAEVRSMLEAKPALARTKLGEHLGYPLDEAVEAGAEDVVLMLLEREAPRTSGYRYRSGSLLHVAAANGMIRVVKKLLASGSNANAMDEDHATPLHHAANHGQAAMIQLLIAHGADVHARSRYGDTALHCCARKIYRDVTVTSVAKRESAEALLQAGAKIDSRNGHGELPFHVAVEAAELPLVKLFAEKGIDVNMTDWQDNTAMFRTRQRRFDFKRDRKDYGPVVECLRERGAKQGEEIRR